MRRLAWLLATGCSFHPGSAPTTGDDGGNGDGRPPIDAPDAGPVGPDWQFKRTLTIDNTNNAALADFPLLVVLSPSRIQYSTAGADLRFQDPSGNPLAYEIESWNASDKSFVWVRVPAIAANATTEIVMLYGNPNATDAQTPAAVWDSDFVGVWHMADAHDSTGHLASTQQGTLTAVPKAQIGTGLAFDGVTSQSIDTMSNAHLTRFTIEAYANADANPALVTNGSSIISRFPNYNLLWDCTQAVFCQTVIYDGGNSGAAGTYRADYSAAKNKWVQLAGTYDGQTLTAYADAAITAGGTLQVSDDPLDAGGATAKIGIRQDGAGPFSGAIDEVRISRIARSQAYFEASRRAAVDAYLGFGDEQMNQ